MNPDYDTPETDNSYISDANKNVFLPEIPLYYANYYKQNLKSKAKNPRKVYWYTDYFIEMIYLNSSEIVDIMNERKRFAGLREYVQKILRTQGQKGYRTRYIIDAQTMQDCYLSVIYINHYLSSVLYHENFYFDYTKTYQYHKNWRNDTDSSEGVDIGSIDGLCVKTLEEKKDDEITEIKLPDSASEPVWYDNRYAMYINAKAYDVGQLAIDPDLVDKYDLIYALECRETTTGIGLGGMGFGFGDFVVTQQTRKPEDALTLAGFKRIYIPDADYDELHDFFEKIAASMNMKVSKTLRFEIIKKEYGKFLQTESDVLAVANALKEYKIFNNQFQKPVTYRDFRAILDSSAARTEYIASKKSDKAKDNPWDELNALVGNDNIKSDVRRMVDALLLDKRRRELGLPGTALTLHSLFFGNPGTAKTTVSRLIARILKHEGVMRGDTFREVVKSEIVGQYVGWTAANVDKIFQELSENSGGILFLDEAYTYSDDPTCFDHEAINSIVQGMENHREIMCIFAGYKAPMQKFVEANPGLRSRIGFVFEFGDYDSAEMFKIAEYQAKVLGFTLPHDCEQMLTNYFAELKRLQGDGWGNGREARKIMEQASLQLAERLARQKHKATKRQCCQLTLDDIKNAVENSVIRERAFSQEQRKKIGF